MLAHTTHFVGAWARSLKFWKVILLLRPLLVDELARPNRKPEDLEPFHLIFHVYAKDLPPYVIVPVDDLGLRPDQNSDHFQQRYILKIEGGDKFLPAHTKH